LKEALRTLFVGVKNGIELNRMIEWCFLLLLLSIVVIKIGHVVDVGSIPVAVVYCSGINIEWSSPM